MMVLQSSQRQAAGLFARKTSVRAATVRKWKGEGASPFSDQKMGFRDASAPCYISFPQ